MNDLQMFPVGSALAYTADFSAELPNGGVTVSSVAWSVEPAESPEVVTASGQSDDLANARSTISVSGVPHGATYILQAKATLSNGEQVAKDITLRGFNG